MIGGGGEVNLDGGVGKEAVSQSGDKERERDVGEREGGKAVEVTEAEIGGPPGAVGGVGGRDQGMTEVVRNGGTQSNQTSGGGGDGDGSAVGWWWKN